MTSLAPTGIASFIIDGSTLHSLLHLLTRGEFKELEGNRQLELQQGMSAIKYIIVAEMSMVGQKVFGQIDHVRQAFPHHAQKVFGGCSTLLLETLANYHQSWTSLSTPLTPAQTSQI